MNAPLRTLATLVALAPLACAPTAQERAADAAVLADTVAALAAASGAEVGVYYRSLASGGDSLALNADVRMHAASTMKVPVMMRGFLDQAEGLRSLDDSVPVTRTFRSIVDGSTFELPMDSDSDTTYYGRVGERVPLRDLVERMITWSSNLATNIVIQETGAERVNAMLREVGADSMQVLRGVEDTKAFEAGLNNTTTARDLGGVMAQVAQGERFSEAERSEMLAILARQHFRENIPAGLPEGTRVANKTGWITRHNHDAAVVFPEGAPPYVLAVMVRGIEEQERAAALVADISRLVWTHHMARQALQEGR
ncbi:MAG: serine hydrolase [Gemmatimonadetes bacterium]|nr:serine hydrolase [Gemmatimonadota bacterium]